MTLGWFTAGGVIATFRVVGEEIRGKWKNRDVVIHTATGQHLRELEAVLEDVGPKEDD